MKVCSKCNLEKEVSEFYVQKVRGYTQAECKSCTKKHTKAYYVKNRESIRKVENALNRARRKVLRSAVFEAYGGPVCACCGEREFAFLTLDHIDNNGAAERLKIAGRRNAAGVHTYTWLVKHGFPPGYQVLCMNCNFGKRMNDGVCPHRGTCNDYSQEVGASAPKRSTPVLSVVRRAG